MLSHLFFWFGFQMLFFAAKFYSSAISRHYVSASLWHSGTCLESVTLKISMCKHQTCQAAGCKKTKQTVKEKWQTEQWVCYLIRFLHMNTNNMYASVKIFGTMTFQITLTVAPEAEWAEKLTGVPDGNEVSSSDPSKHPPQLCLRPAAQMA